MKNLLKVIILISVIFVGVPLIVGLFFDGEEEAAEDLENKIKTPNSIEVWIQDKGKSVTVDFEEYVACVVASEMPADFGEEALKAQSVAARTYAMAKIIKYDEKKPESHPKSPICDTTHCQAYRPEKDLIAVHAEGWEKRGWKAVQEACRATEGELLYYDGRLVMQPLFFSSSGGQTENSEDVFVGAYPYLVSVSSPHEDGASHADEQKEFTLKEMQTALEKKYPGKLIGELKTDSIKILSRTAGGRVEQMQVGQSVFKGTEIRNALGLSSALFATSFKESEGKTKIIFNSNGFGHGVGLSQYGARGMAKEGNDYKQILSHYYTGTKVY